MLGPGTYQIEVTDASGCTLDSVVSLLAISPLVIDSVIVTAAICNLDNGEIEVIASGSAGFEFSINGVTWQTTALFDSLAAGNYTVSVRDSNNCVVTENTTIINFPPPTFGILQGVSPSVCGQANGQIIMVSGSGGTQPFLFSIDSGMTFQVSDTFSNLYANTYNAVIQDSNGCMVFKPLTVLDLPGPEIGSINTQQSTCGSNNGQISVSVINGLPPFVYSIDGTNWQSSNVFNGLSSGSYQVIVEDLNECRDTSQLITIINPGAPVIDSIGIIEPSCNQNNGAITVYAAGGISPLLYTLNGANQFSNIFLNQSPGSYSITVTDDTGCQIDTSIILSNQAGPTFDNIIIDHPDCNMNTGIIAIIASGGTPPYQYSIDNGATFSTSNLFLNLPVGSYFIVIKDSQDCQEYATSFLQNQLGPSIDSMQIIPTSCINYIGGLSAMASGGTAPYSYLWSTIPPQTNMTATGLVPGQYMVTISDSNNCSTVGIGIVEPPTPSQVDLGADLSVCGFPDEQLDAGPGNSYLWSTGATTQTITADLFGQYYITLTDIGNCITYDTIEIIEFPFNPAVTPSTSIPTGTTIQLEASGGVSYNWWPGTDLSCVSCPDPVATPSDSITYFVEIEGPDDCVDTLSVNINLFIYSNPIDPPIVITNNDDGVNENWVIPNIEYYVYNRVVIVNRWGDVVYEAVPYTNDWDGTSNGKPLPQGTYYYYIELDVSQVNTQKGAITIIR